MTLFLGLEWFSIALYVLTRDRHRPDRVARGGAQVPGRRLLRLGGAALRLRARLRGDQAASASTRSPRASARTASTATWLLVLGLALIIAGLGFQVLGRAVPHVDARRLRGRAETRHGLHVGRDEGGGDRARAGACSRAASRRTRASGRWAFAGIAVASLAIGNLAALVQRNVKRILAYSSVSRAGFLLIGLSAGTALGGPRGHVLPGSRTRRWRSARSRSSRRASASLASR